MDEHLKRQIESLKPSIDDAPTRVRKQKNKSPIGISTILAISLIGGIIYMGDRNGWADHLKQHIAPPTAGMKQEHAPVSVTDQRINIGEASEAAKDIYLEQVNKMLHQNGDYVRPTRAASRS